MFKANPHFNEYYGLIHQNKNQKKRLKRTQFSGQKLGSSKKSFSKDSRSDVEIHPYNKNSNLPNFTPNFTNRKNGESHKNHNSKPHKIEEAIGQNILDQFKLFKPEKQERIRATHSKQTLNKFIGIDNQDEESSKNISRNQGHKLSVGDYFGDIADPRHIKLQRNMSKSKSHKSRQSRSPLRKILKSKSRQQIYTPVQKMNNVIKLEQKLKQRHAQNQKTLKHINYYKTLNELNQTYLNEVSHRLKQVRSEKKLHSKTKMTLHHQGSREVYRQAMQQSYSGQKSIQSMLKRVKSDKRSQMSIKQSRGKPKMSTQKIKQYFLNKEQNQRNHQKIKGILENVKANNHIEQKFRKVKSQKMLPQIRVNFDEQSSVSNSIASYSKRKDERQFYTQKKNPYNRDDSSQINQRSSLLQYSDYGFQFPKSPQKGKKIKFQKNPHHNVSIQKSHNQIQEQDSDGFIDTGKSFGQIKLNQLQIECSDAYEINSVASIEERLIYQIQKKSSCLGSQRSIGSKQCIINVKSPQKSGLSQPMSINTPIFRNKNDKKPKQSIISKLKKDIAEDKLKSSKRSKLSSSKVLKRNSSISKKQPQPISVRPRQKLKIQTHQQKQESEYLSVSNNLNDQQRPSKMGQFSNLIHSASPSHYNKSNNQDRSPYLRQQDPSIGIQSPVNIEGSYFNQIESERSIQMSKKSSNRSWDAHNLNSMINSNKAGSHKNSQKGSNLLKNLQIPREKVSDSSQAQSPINLQIKTPVKFVKVLKKQELRPVQIPKMEESNLNEMTDSNPTFSESANSSQSSPFLSNSSMSQSARMLKNSTSKNIKNDKNLDSKPKSILEQQISECQSQSLQLSVNMSSSGSQSSKQLKRKDLGSESRNTAKVSSLSLRQGSISSSGQSPANLQTSRFSSSQNNLNIDSKSSFSVSNSNAGSSRLLKNQSKKLGFNTINNNSTSFKKKKNFAEYTLNDVARFIQQHEFRIEAYCVYIDNCRQIYQEDYQLQKTQLLSFLMLKKNLFQLHRTIAALQGKGENVFNLTDIQILDEVLEDYLDREEIKQQLKNLISEQKSTKQQFLEMHASLEKKYSGEKGFSLALQKDDFSYEIVKRLGQQLNLLYQKWQKSKSDGDRKTASMLGQKYQKRMVQIIELIFLTSELDGKKVKTCELICDKDPQFRPYYEKWFEGIIQTIEYFDSKSKNYSSQG